jgi:hypothetical protein
VGAVGGGRSSWPSVSRFRFVPRDEDSFNPSEVAFINIWCLSGRVISPLKELICEIEKYLPRARIAPLFA